MSGNIVVGASPAISWAVYLPLIVTILAVALGFVANTALEAIKASAQHAHTAQTIRRVLLEELRAVLEAMRRATEQTSKHEDGGFFVVPIPERLPFYEANVANLGVLESDEVVLVARAYSYIKAMPEFLIHVGTLQRSYDIVLAALVPSAEAERLGRIATKLRDSIEPAVMLLEERVRRGDVSFWDRFRPWSRR